MEPIAAYARLNARLMPTIRGEDFEDPLIDALEANGFGEVTGGGSLLSEDGEIEYCGMDIDLHDVEKAVPFICEFLTALGAPKGSMLEYEVDGRKESIPFGATEGLAIYLDGVDLPDEVYSECDLDTAFDEINRLLGDHGEIRSHWQGPRETALYIYGASADEMRGLIADYLAEYPLCQNARVVHIA